MQLPLVSELDPRVLAGLTAQQERRRAVLAAGARRVGWKMGRGIEEIEAVMGPEPVTGYLTSASMLASGATHDAGDAVALRGETELALWIGDADGTIAGLATALELVDVGRARGTITPLLAANVFHRAFALGAVRPPGPTTGRKARLSIDGALRGGGALLADYTDTVDAAQRRLAAVGEALRPGDVILSGSAVHVPVAPGQRVSGEIDGLDRVELTIAP